MGTPTSTSQTSSIGTFKSAINIPMSQALNSALAANQCIMSRSQSGFAPNTTAVDSAAHCAKNTPMPQGMTNAAQCEGESTTSATGQNAALNASSPTPTHSTATTCHSVGK